MSRFDDLDLGDGGKPIRATVGISKYDDLKPLSLNGGGGWLTSLLLFTTIVFGGLYVRTLIRGGGTDDGGDDPAPKGKYVAIFYDDDEMSEYTSAQRNFLNSVDLTNYLEENTDAWHRLDIDDSVSKLPSVFRQMAEKHRTSLPWVVVVAGGKFASEPINDSEQTYELFKKWLK